MRIVLTFLISFLAVTTWANMASPIQEGSMASTPFISRHVDILKESLIIIPDDQFQTARFIVEYHIKANRSGSQIPLLFYASELKGQFTIWLDGREISLSQVPESYQKLEGTPFTDFGYFFEKGDWSETQQVLLEESPSSGFYVSIDDLKFFETDLIEGIHEIRVEYVADQWVDRSGWVKEYSFRYALSPAKYWKSFGDLKIILDATNFAGRLTTNLGDPATGDLQTKSTWTFSALPTEVILIKYTPEPNPLAGFLLAVSPIGLTIILAILLVVLHIAGMKLYRKVNPEKGTSWVMITGSFLVPFLTLFGYIYAFGLIDAAIGQDAGRYHGYTFLVLILYPILLPVYWIVMRWVDKRWSR